MIFIREISIGICEGYTMPTGDACGNKHLVPSHLGLTYVLRFEIIIYLNEGVISKWLSLIYNIRSYCHCTSSGFERSPVEKDDMNAGLLAAILVPSIVVAATVVTATVCILKKNNRYVNVMLGRKEPIEVSKINQDWSMKTYIWCVMQTTLHIIKLCLAVYIFLFQRTDRISLYLHTRKNLVRTKMSQLGVNS